MYIYDTVALISSCNDISDKSCTENQHTQIVFTNAFPGGEKKEAFMEYYGKNMVQPDMPQIPIRRMRNTC